MIHLSISFSWSLKIDKGISKRVNNCSSNTSATASASLLRSGNASAQFVYETIHVRIQTCPLSLFRWGPVKSIYHRSYGASATTGFNGICFVSFSQWYSVNSRHLWQNGQYLLSPGPIKPSSYLTQCLLDTHCSSVTEFQCVVNLASE